MLENSWQFTSGDSAKDTDYILRNHVLNVPSNTSNITIGKLTGGSSSSQGNILVEYKRYRGLDSTTPTVLASKRVRSRAQKLARLLAPSREHDLSTTPFKDMLNQEEQEQYAFIFDYPSNDDWDQEPLSFYSVIHLNDLDNRLDLYQRFDMKLASIRSMIFTLSE